MTNHNRLSYAKTFSEASFVLCRGTFIQLVILWDFQYVHSVYLFVSELIMLTPLSKNFKNVFSTTVLSGSLLCSVLENGNFLNIDISQGRVATCLRCGGIFNKKSFIANLLLILSVKEFKKIG